MFDLSSEGVVVLAAGKREARLMSKLIRKEDAVEIKASGNFYAETATRCSINRSVEAWGAYKDGKLLAVFGIAVQSNLQVPWILSTVHVDEFPLTYWRCCKKVVSAWRDRYPLMMNMVHGRYTRALRWVERLGFVLSPPEKWGTHGDLFCQATMHTQKIGV